MTPESHSGRRRFLLRFGVSIGLLCALVWVIDAGAVVARLVRMEVAWAVPALAISIGQIAASTWRWRFTAGRLGLELPFVDALREYYLATFLNQVLPGGVVGDVSRAWRHARRQDAQAAAAPAVHAVILERASGQAVMMVVAVVSLFSLSVTPVGGPRSAGLSAAILVGLVLGAVAVLGRHRSQVSAMGRLLDDARRGLVAGVALPVQVTTSVLVVGSYIVTFLLAARGVGVDLPLRTLLPLVAPVLVTMLIPVTVAGWGLRESAAAALWGISGLTVADGVSVSAAYGLLILIASVPGGLVLALRPSIAGRGRTGYPRPDENGDTADAAPGAATRSGSA